MIKNIFDYGATIINLNHNKKYKIDTTIEYVDDITDNINPIIKDVVLKDIPITTTCYDLINHVYNHAAREIEPPSDFNGEKVGNVLIPLSIQDEFPEVSGAYSALFNRPLLKSPLLTELNFSSSNNNTNATLIKRIYSGRCIMMPFALAFNPALNKSFIYENINPERDEDGNLTSREEIYNPMNGIVISNINENVDLPLQNGITSLSWKNLALLSDTPAGSSNMLIYFKWIYEFYKAAFLYNSDNIITRSSGKNITPVVDPHFHRMENANLVGGDAETFARINANTIILKSTDPLKEALFYVGRALKSYIYMNSLFGFKINGSILRHPGEIIKINSTGGEPDESPSSGFIGGMESNANGFVFAYTTSISHMFSGSTYENLVYASKICNLRD